MLGVSADVGSRSREPGCCGLISDSSLFYHAPVRTHCLSTPSQNSPGTFCNVDTLHLAMDILGSSTVFTMRLVPPIIGVFTLRNHRLEPDADVPEGADLGCVRCKTVCSILKDSSPFLETPLKNAVSDTWSSNGIRGCLVQSVIYRRPTKEWEHLSLDPTDSIDLYAPTDWFVSTWLEYCQRS